MELIITPEEKHYLLENARETIAAGLEAREGTYGPLPQGRALEAPCGAFVSLYSRTGGEEKQLRGCIGTLASTKALLSTVRLMAYEAAFRDPRFPPLTKEEFPGLMLEISVLSPMSPCGDPRHIIVGVHGLYLVSRSRSGVLLPQVPVEQGWDLEEYLHYICLKAGLPQGAYADPEAKLYTFTAEVFA
ncbi:MAG: AmmeMemoRadiSam system protein A [Treponema sp.]|nr:AmmeMemoRadiSam system protein A [Treponema sp.]